MSEFYSPLNSSLVLPHSSFPEIFHENHGHYHSSTNALSNFINRFSSHEVSNLLFATYVGVLQSFVMILSETGYSTRPDAIF